MKIRKNARLTPHGRSRLVRRVLAEGQTPQTVANAFGVSVKTMHKWVDRFQAEGCGALINRSGARASA